MKRISFGRALFISLTLYFGLELSAKADPLSDIFLNDYAAIAGVVWSTTDSEFGFLLTKAEAAFEHLQALSKDRLRPEISDMAFHTLARFTIADSRLFNRETRAIWYGQGSERIPFITFIKKLRRAVMELYFEREFQTSMTEVFDRAASGDRPALRVLLDSLIVLPETFTFKTSFNSEIKNPRFSYESYPEFISQAIGLLMLHAESDPQIWKELPSILLAKSKDDFANGIVRFGFWSFLKGPFHDEWMSTRVKAEFERYSNIEYSNRAIDLLFDWNRADWIFDSHSHSNNPFAAQLAFALNARNPEFRNILIRNLIQRLNSSETAPSLKAKLLNFMASFTQEPVPKNDTALVQLLISNPSDPLWILSLLALSQLSDARRSSSFLSPYFRSERFAKLASGLWVISDDQMAIEAPVHAKLAQIHESSKYVLGNEAAKCAFMIEQIQKHIKGKPSDWFEDRAVEGVAVVIRAD